MSSSQTEVKRCQICNNLLTSATKYLKLCRICNEYFPDGNKEFHLVYGTNKSFTAVVGNTVQLRLISPQKHAEKFCRSVDQLLKSDLKRLEVSLECFQTQKEMQSLANFIYNHSPLKVLDIALSDSEHLKIVLDAIETSSNIRKLRLKNGCENLSELNAKHLASMLSNNESIRRLIVLCPKSDKQTAFVESVYGGISNNQSIKSLTINCFSNKPFKFSDSIGELILAGFGSEGIPERGSDVEKFLQAALTTSRSIRRLKMTHSYLDFISIIQYNTSIQHLELVKTRANVQNINDTFDTLSRVLKCHPTLTFINLDIDMYQLQNLTNVQPLIAGLQQSSSIKKFHWNYISYSTQFVESILNGVSQVTKLQELKISDVTDRLEHAAPFFDALKSPFCSLKKLNLDYCNVHENNSLSFAQALEANTSLEDVSILYTQFNDEALKVIQRWLVNNVRLKSFKFRIYKPSENCIDIGIILRKNTTLKTLDYDMFDDIDNIVDAWTVNDTLTNMKLRLVGPYEKFAEIMKEKVIVPWSNRALRKLTCNWPMTKIISDFLQKNIEYQSSMHMNTIILIHNISRDRSAFERLPCEIWLLIFENIRYPGLYNFKSTADRIFRMNKPQ